MLHVHTSSRKFPHKWCGKRGPVIFLWTSTAKLMQASDSLRPPSAARLPGLGSHPSWPTAVHIPREGWLNWFAAKAKSGADSVRKSPDRIVTDRVKLGEKLDRAARPLHIVVDDMHPDLRDAE